MSVAAIQAVLKYHTKTKGANRWVLLALAWYTNQETGECFPSIATIASFAGISPRQVKRSIASLRRKHKITTKKRGPRRSLSFILKTPGAYAFVGTPRHRRGDTMSPVRGHHVPSTTGDTMSPPKVVKGIETKSSSALRATTTTGFQSKTSPVAVVKEEPPTWLEVERLFEKGGFKSLPKTFWDWNQEKGWTGISASVSWQALARKWEARQRKPRYAPEPEAHEEREAPKRWRDPDDPGLEHEMPPNLSKKEQARWIADVTKSRVS